MNYIAHAFFSRSYDLFMLGQLLGDFATRRALENHADTLIQGVVAHRGLDRFTDDHPAFRKGCSILDKCCHRYSPVVMDVAIDFYLVKNWSDFSAEMTFERFLEKLYSTIHIHEDALPERMKNPATRMRQMDWFSGFASMDGLAIVFYYMAKRVRRAEWIQAAQPCIENNLEELEILCLELLSDDRLINFSSTRF
jgi:acyl carrier protein phosphodiesterase